jgi:hypothetical protein
VRVNNCVAILTERVYWRQKRFFATFLPLGKKVEDISANIYSIYLIFEQYQPTKSLVKTLREVLSKP